MVRWGMLDRMILQARLCEWLRNELSKLEKLERVRCLFVPQKRRFSGSMSFPLDAVLSGTSNRPQHSALSPRVEELRPSMPACHSWEDAFVAAPAASSRVDALLERCLRGDGVIGVAILDPIHGICLGRRGRWLNPDVVWAHIQFMNVIQRLETATDSIVCSDEHYHLVRLFSDPHPLCVYAIVDAQVSLALARLELKQATASSAEESLR